jgi:N,N'-diacetyllegionaminate synthase
MARTLVIAEIGSCHDGNLGKAITLIDAARDAGADVAKFQFWSDPDELAARRRVPANYREIYRRYRLIPEWLPILRVACLRRGIEFAATCYLPQDVAVVAPFVRRFKVASFEAGASDLRQAHRPFLEADASKHVIVSLGMGGAAHAGTWLADLRGDDASAERVRFLHCVSAYPAPAGALNLQTLRAGVRHGILHGLSDHTAPDLTWTGALAVAAGATILEAHLRLEETDDANPDAPHAMNPRQFDSYVRHVRFAEACLGDSLGAGLVQECEREMAEYRVGVNR